jgi:hypothetical protein
MKQLKKMNTKQGKAKEAKIQQLIKNIEKGFIWHVTGKITTKRIYHIQQKYNGKYNFLNDVEVEIKNKRIKETTYEDFKEEIDSMRRGSKEEAIEEFEKEMYTKHEKIDPSPDVETRVQKIEILSAILLYNGVKISLFGEGQFWREST